MYAENEKKLLSRFSHSKQIIRFSAEAALPLVKIACEMPDKLGVSLSQQDAAESAHKLIADGIAESISLQTVQRILSNHKLKPWRHHLRQNAKAPRDEAFCAAVKEICDHYTRPLQAGEIVLSLDVKANLQLLPINRLSLKGCWLSLLIGILLLILLIGQQRLFLKLCPNAKRHWLRLLDFHTPFTGRCTKTVEETMP